METLGQAILELSTRDVGLSRGIDQARRSARGMTRQVTGDVREMGKSLTGLVTGPLAKLTAALGAVGVGFSAVGLIRSAVNVAAEFDTLNVRLVTLTGSLEGARQASAWITDFTQATPLQLADVSRAFADLTAAGLDATRFLGPIGDAVSAFGGGAAEIDRVTHAFTRMAAENKATFETLNLITSTGIPAFRILGEELNLTGEQLQDIAKSGIPVQRVFEALATGFEKRFEGAMEQISRTWTGILSNIQDTWTLMQKAIMDGGLFDFLKAGADIFRESMNDALITSEQGAKRWAQTVIAGIEGMAIGVAHVLDLLSHVIGVMDQIAASVRRAHGLMQSFGQGLASVLGFAPQVERLREGILGVFQGGEGAADSFVATTRRGLDAIAARQEEQRRKLAEFAERAKGIERLPATTVTAPKIDTAAQRKAEQEAKRHAEELARIFEQTRTPFEAFQLEVQRLQGLSGLSTDTLGRAVGQLANEFAKGTPEFQRWNEEQQRAGTILASIQTPFERFQTRLAELEQLQPHLTAEQFGRAVGQLANELAQADPALQAFYEAQIRGAQLAVSLRTPYEQFNETIRELADLLMQGAISQETFDRAVTQGVVTVRKATEDTRELDQAARSFALTFASSFEEAIFSGERFSDVLAGLLDDIARLAFRLAITAPLINLFQGLFSNVAPASAPGISAGFFSLPRAQHGLNFRVGGSGGIDSQLVQFMATPGERVMAIPPGQSLGGSVVHIHNYSGAPVSQERRQGTGGQEEIHVLIGRAVAKEMGRPGSAPNTVLRGGGWNHGLIGR